MPSEFTVERASFVSHGLGLPGFPVGTEESSEVGDHIMGVAVIGWLTHHPVSRWGEAWASCVSLDVRFRAQLTEGLPLTTTVVGDDRSIEFCVADERQVYCTGSATRSSDAAARSLRRAEVASRPGKVTPDADALRDRTFPAMSFEFDAARDLAFVRHLADGATWRDRGWAHPAWLASATNALLRRSIDFGDPGTWLNAGMSIRQHAPIVDGATIILAGGIDELFERGRHSFAVAGITAWANGEPAASLRNTFVYASNDEASAR